MSSERRQADRIPVGIYVQQVVEDDLHRCFTTSLSSSGLFMERTAAPLDRGSSIVQIEIPLPGESDSLWTKARIVYDCIDSIFHGTAVHFEAMAGGHQRLLDEWIAYMRSQLYIPVPGPTRTDLARVIH